MRTLTLLVALVVFLLAASLSPLPASSAEEPKAPAEPRDQGTIITCEECVILYPGRYREHPESCRRCNGKKERFQAARMMDGELVSHEAAVLEGKIEALLFRAVSDAIAAPVKGEMLKEIRALYVQKLIFHLVYNRFEREPITKRILELDGLIEKSGSCSHRAP